MKRGLNFFLVSISPLALALLLFVFFTLTKHWSYLSSIAPFLDDPYDAVGSFGIQLAFITSLLSLFWFFRRNRIKLFKSGIIVVLSVLVTLGADIIAMIRYQPLWIEKQEGQFLLLSVIGLTIISLAVGCLMYSFGKLSLKKRSLAKALIISLIAVIILALYPDGFRQGDIGGIGTALVGMLLFFVTVWVWVGQPKLNGKKLPWIVLLGVIMGLGLVGIEFLREGGDVSKLLLVASVFMGIEGSAVTVGYVLLSDYLS